MEADFFLHKSTKTKKTETAINSVLRAFEDSSDAEKSIKKVSRKLTSTLRRQTLVRTPA
jgi:ribosome-associated translation inhibitor RaiA